MKDFLIIVLFNFYELYTFYFKTKYIIIIAFNRYNPICYFIDYQ